MPKITFPNEISLATKLCLELYAKYYGSGKWLGPVEAGETESRARLLRALGYVG